MRPIKISIPALTGSFHHQAATRYFGKEVTILHAADMRTALEYTKDNLSDYALLACENTSAGLFYETYRLINESDLFILDEVYESVSLCLAAREDQDVTRITHVVSHPYAILQVQDQLSERGLHVHSLAADTVTASHNIRHSTDQTIACICSEQTACDSGLKILLRNMQKHHENHTRFFIIGKGSSMHDQFDKVIGVTSRRNWNPESLGIPALTSLKLISDNRHSELYYEIPVRDGWHSTLPEAIHAQGGKIIGFTRQRKSIDTISNTIHISL